MIQRCKTGRRLLQKWAADVQNATMQTWQHEMFKPRAFDRHVARCKICSQAAIKAPSGDKHETARSI